jgi:hypothetical protein
MQPRESTRLGAPLRVRCACARLCDALARTPVSRSRSSRAAGKQVHSEYGADRTYTGETYAAFAAGQQRVQADRPDGLMPPSALRRSMSSRVAGMGVTMEESTPAKLKRKVSWAGNTVRSTQLRRCRALDARACAATPCDALQRPPRRTLAPARAAAVARSVGTCCAGPAVASSALTPAGTLRAAPE